MASSMFDNASLYITPSGYKASFLYPTKPLGTANFTVVRGTTATRVNSEFLIESVANNVPRLDYSGGVSCPALLVEGAATNLLLRSEEFGDAVWGGGSTLLVNANVTTSPGGTANADRIIGDGTFGVKNRNASSVSIVSGTVYTMSCFAKQDTTGLFQLWFSATTFGTNQYANFNLSTGQITFQSGGLISVSITPYGNGWYRCSITGTATATAAGSPAGVALADLTTNRLPSFTTANGLFVWGAMFNEGGLSSYIPTVASTVTRNADVISLTGVSSLIGQTQGTLYAEVDVQKLLGTTTRGILTISDASVANRVQLGFTGAAANTIRVIYQGNSTLNYNFAVSAIGVYKLAFAYSASSAAFYVNGSLVLSSGGNSFSAPVGNINLGSTFDSGNQLNDRIRAAAIYTSRLSNDELASLTTL